MASGTERMIAIHGFLGRPADWTLVFGSEISFVAVDLWPMARSLYSLNGYKSWREEFLSRDFAGKPVLVGYSMGGRLAMHAALAAPERFAGAIFVSANPGLTSEDERAARLRNDQVWAEQFRSDKWEHVLRAWNAQSVLQPPPRTLAPDAIELKRVESDFDREALAIGMTAWSLGAQRDLRAELARLTMPILYVTGSEDAKFTSMMAALPLPAHHRHVVVSGAGHRVPWDQPRAFRDLVREFVARVSGA